MFESGSYRSQPGHAALYDILEVYMDCKNREEFIEATVKSRKRRRDDQDPPPPPPKYSDQSKKKRHESDASASKQPQAQMSSAWKTSDTREAPSSSSKKKTAPQSEQPVDDVLIPDDEHISDSKDTDAAYLPKIKARPDWLKPANAIANAYKDPEENKLIRKTGDRGSFIKWYCKQIRKSKLSKADLEGPAFKLVRPFYKNNISLQFQMEECHLLLTDKIDLVNSKGNRVVPDVSKPLSLGGLPGDNERRNALSISKLKAAHYPDFGLEELVPSLWIESKREYDISAAYGISHWWFERKEFYITRHIAPYDRRLVRSHIADYKEYKISEADFKNLHPNDFEDLYLLHLQGNLNHLSGAYKDATDFLFKEDYTIIHKPRAIIYKDRNNQKKMMRESELHKFSDGTLTRILEELDHMVKDYVLFKFNPGMEHRIWSEDDKRRSKEFIEVSERRFKIKRIFRSLESFVSESHNWRDLPRDNPLVSVEVFSEDGNPGRVNIKQALDAPVLRTASAAAKPCQGDSSDFYLITVFPTVAAGSRRQVRFITTCSYLTDTSKDIMKAKVYVSKLLQL
ncbi:hypothetical protein Tco_0213228 [Tanacetum coccineum]